MRSDRLLVEVLDSGLDDWVPECEVAWLAKSEGGGHTDDEIREISISVVRALLKRGFVRIGSLLKGKGFVPWEVPVEQAIERIEREWDSFFLEPGPGNMFWLENTAEGDSYVRSIS